MIFTTQQMCATAAGLSVSTGRQWLTTTGDDYVYHNVFAPDNDDDR